MANRSSNFGVPFADQVAARADYNNKRILVLFDDSCGMAHMLIGKEDFKISKEDMKIGKKLLDSIDPNNVIASIEFKRLDPSYPVKSGALAYQLAPQIFRAYVGDIN